MRSWSIFPFLAGGGLVGGAIGTGITAGVFFTDGDQSNDDLTIFGPVVGIAGGIFLMGVFFLEDTWVPPLDESERERLSVAKRDLADAANEAERAKLGLASGDTQKRPNGDT